MKNPLTTALLIAIARIVHGPDPNGRDETVGGTRVFLDVADIADCIKANP